MGLLLLFLSVPFFYILGIVQLASWFSGGNKKSRKTYLETAIKELAQKQNQSSGSLLEEYKNELKSILPNDYTPTQERITQPQISENIIQAEAKSPLHQDVGKLVSNWYSNNTIDLILYIGAFLIVVAASIFVGFQWETISGITKASVLTILTVTFLIFGIIFHNFQKIKNAGSTFIAISALLIPICGSAWYNFVIKPAGGGPGLTWLITSIISIIAYVSLALFFRSTFYAYITGIASLSLTLSTVNILNLNSNFYILASIIACFVLLFGSLLARAQKLDLEKIFSTPFEISSDIILPSSMLIGFMTAISNNKLYSLEAFLSLLLASLFYLISYYNLKHSWRLYLAQILFPLSAVLFFGWQNIGNIVLFYALSSLGIIYVFLSQFLLKGQDKSESDGTIVIGFITQVVALFCAFSYAPNSSHVAILSLYPAASGILIAILRKNISSITLSSCSVALFLYLYFLNILKFTNHIEYLSVAYIILGIIFYAATSMLRGKKEYVQTLAISTTIFLGLGVLFSLGNKDYLLVNSIIISLIQLIASFRFKQPMLTYGSSIFFYLSLFISLNKFNIQAEFYPVAFALLSYLFYSFSLIKENIDNKQYRIIGLVGALATIAFSIPRINNDITQIYTLATAYGATLLYGIDTLINKKPNFGYLTSAIGMVTFLWQINYSGARDILIYCTSLGIYFMALAYTRLIKKDQDSRQALDTVGLFILLSPPFVLSFTGDAVKYSGTLGIEGILLLLIGISLSYKLYRNAGILGIVFAVLPHTYSYILSLPRWLVVGLFGFLFLGFGIFLLLRRKDNTSTE